MRAHRNYGRYLVSEYVGRGGGGGGGRGNPVRDP